MVPLPVTLKKRAQEMKNEVENGRVVVHDEHGRFEIIE